MSDGNPPVVGSVTFGPANPEFCAPSPKGGFMDFRPDGNYVRRSDYEKLCVEIEEWQRIGRYLMETIPEHLPLAEKRKMMRLLPIKGKALE